MNPEKRNGKWRIRVYLGKDENGKKVYKSVTAETKTAVKYKAQEIKDAVDKEKGLTYISVGDAIEKYINLKSNILSPSTIKAYKAIRRNNLQSIMDVPLYDLTNDKVQTAINIEAAIHSPKTVRNVHGLLSSTLGVYRPEFTLNTTLPQKKKQESYVPNTDDVSRLLLITEGTVMYIPILLAATLSLRRSEVCALTWNDVDFDTNKITVRHAKVKNYKNEWVIKDPKTYNSFRTLTMSPILALKLKEQPRDDVFITSLSPSAVTDRFDDIIKNNGFKKFTFHSLRHYNASVMLALNLPDKYAMERGGWASMKTMKNIYQHTFASEQTKYDKMLADYFNQFYHN